PVPRRLVSAPPVCADHPLTPIPALPSLPPLFSPLLPPPPWSTLFPYTTLFRSLGAVTHYSRSPSVACAWGATPGSTTLSSSAARDRKSTRLNSSHLGISYAVFCLKKKKNNPYTADGCN